MECPKCHHQNPTGAKFCMECGAKLENTCLKCGAKLPVGAKFCMECGAKVSEPPPSLREKKQALVDYTTSLEEAQRQFKKKHIKNILLQTEGNKSKAAEILQIQRTYLSRLIKELDIEG